jgi:hypothetical protein
MLTTLYDLVLSYLKGSQTYSGSVDTKTHVQSQGGVSGITFTLNDGKITGSFNDEEDGEAAAEAGAKAAAKAAAKTPPSDGVAGRREGSSEPTFFADDAKAGVFE